MSYHRFSEWYSKNSCLPPFSKAIKPAFCTHSKQQKGNRHAHEQNSAKCVMQRNVGVTDINCWNPATKVPSPINSRHCTAQMLGTTAKSCCVICSSHASGSSTKMYGYAQKSTANMVKQKQGKTARSVAKGD